MSDGNQLTTLIETDAFRIRASDCKGEHLVISFASIGKGFHLLPPDEFVGTILGMDSVWGMFVSDNRRSWMNDRDFLENLKRTVLQQIETRKPKTITTLGLSLGAFSALVAPDYFPVDTAIALSPQYSVSPNIFPTEKRWRFWTKKIRSFAHATVEPLNGPTKYYVLHGLIDDAHHMERFPKQPNLRHFVFPDAEHSQIGNILKRNKKIEPLLRAAMQDEKRVVSRIVRPLGGIWRGKFESAMQNRIESG